MNENYMFVVHICIGTIDHICIGPIDHIYIGTIDHIYIDLQLDQKKDYDIFP